MASVLLRWRMMLERYTLREIFDKVKFGRLVGTDHMGNKYYEDLNEQHGQHRWVEYKDKWNFDAAMIPPSWSGWMNHTFDEPGFEVEPWLEKKAAEHTLLNLGDSSPYKSHVGMNASGIDPNKQLLHNLTQQKNRGYKIGNHHKPDPDAPDEFYSQPGAASHPVDRSWKQTKGVEFWDPDHPTGDEKWDQEKKTGGGLRDLNKI